MLTKRNIIQSLQANRSLMSTLGVKDLGLFGSYARGEETEVSDIDILVDFYPEKENFDNLMALYDLLERLFKNQKIEVVTKNGLSPYIGPQILKEVQYV
jgi:predicted nucleotidyltransferase